MSGSTHRGFILLWVRTIQSPKLFTKTNLPRLFVRLEPLCPDLNSGNSSRCMTVLRSREGGIYDVSFFIVTYSFSRISSGYYRRTQRGYY